MDIGSRKLWRRWVIAFTLGELIGFGGIPVFGACIALQVTAGLDAAVHSLILYGIVIVGGLGEGAMLAPTLDDFYGLSSKARAAIWLPAAFLILVAIGIAQSFALRGVVRFSRSWIVGNVLGWFVALPWTFVLPALLPDNAPIAWWVAIFVVAGVLIGRTAGMITGLFLLRLVPIAAGPERK